MNYFITIKDFNDKEHIGEWNGKYYDSNKPKGKYEFSLYRVYINNVEVHIKKEQKSELEQLKAKLDVPEKIEKCRAYITEALKQATDNELKEEMVRRNLINREDPKASFNNNFNKDFLQDRVKNLEID